MTTESSNRSDHATVLEQVLADYLHSVEAGEPLDQQELLRKHPDLADELRSFFANCAEIERLAEPLKGSGYDATIGLGASRTAVDSSRVRYFGDYELLEEIARGGMGVVYKARQVNLDRVVALKMILSGQLASAADVRRFYQEAEAAANLEHPGIVPIFEVGEHEGQHFFSMGYIDGPSLAELLADGPLPPREAARVVRQVAEAIAYAHSRGVIHRDLKPANILMQAGDRRPEAEGRKSKGDVRGDRSPSKLQPPVSSLQPRVTDFGLAKRTEGTSELTGTGQILGTPSYMPPEQASGRAKEIGPAADVYSLGAVLYCALTGHPPFQAANPMDTLLQVMKNEPPAPRQLNPQTPKDLETICLKCLEKEPHKRYHSAQALADDLDRWLNGQPILARPVGRGERVAKWIKRHPAVSALLLLVVVAMVGGTIVSTYFAVKANWAMDGERDARKTAEQLADKERSARREQERLKNLAQQKGRESERLLYAARINLAQTAFRDHQARRIRELLSPYAESSSAEDLRGWEWHFLWRQSHQELAVFPGTTNAVAYSPDGNYLATAHLSDFDPTGGRSDGPANIYVWNVATNKLYRTLKGYTHSGARALSFTADGERLVSAGYDRSVRVHSLADGEQQSVHQQATLYGGMGVQVAVSPGGSYVASCAGKVDVWGVREARVLHTFKYDDAFDSAFDIAAPTFSGDGLRLAFRSPNSLHICDPGTGRDIQRIRVQQHLGHALALSHDGTLVAGVRAPHVISIWKVENGQLDKAFPGEHDIVRSLAFTPDDKYLISGHGDGTLRIWNTSDGTLAGIFSGQLSIGDIAVHPDGTRFASAGNDNRGDDTRVWSLAALAAFRTLKPPEHRLRNCVFGADSQQLLVAAEDLHLIDVNTGRVLWKQNKAHLGRVVTALRTDPQRGRCATADSERIVLWDLKTGERVRELTGRPRIGAQSIDFSPDGRLLVSTGKDQWGFATEIALWDLASGEKTRTWNRPTIRPREDMPREELEEFAVDVQSKISKCVRFSPDAQQIASGHDDGRVRLWDPRGDLLATLEGHTAPVASVAYSSDAALLASGSWDRTIRIRDREGSPVHVLRGHTGLVLSVEFSPDDRRLLSRGFDNVVKIWDIHSGQELLTLEAAQAGASKAGGWAASFSPDGNMIVAQGEGIRLWSAQPFNH